jgi:hypothetical protein
MPNETVAGQHQISVLMGGLMLLKANQPNGKGFSLQE